MENKYSTGADMRDYDWPSWTQLGHGMLLGIIVGVPAAVAFFTVGYLLQVALGG